MYTKYSTDALVLHIRDVEEADRVYALYTEEFGLLYARAQSVREERSRLRYALILCSSARISLVRGRRGWRVTNASPGAALVSKGAAAFARVTRLLLRLVGGVERNEYLFASLREAHTQLCAGSRSSATIATIELVCVARMLHALGYLSAEALGTTLFAHAGYGTEHLEEAELMREKFLSSVNRALIESHL